MKQAKIGRLALLSLMWPVLMAAECGTTIKCPEGQGFIDGTDQCQPKECFANPVLCEDGGMSVCDTCTADQHCDLANAKCVACLEDNHCGTDKPKCDTGSGECVACKVNDDCSDATPFCDGETNTCVACLMNDHCEDANAPQCNDGVCGDCSVDAACERFAGTPKCGGEGVCVKACAPNPADPSAEVSECPDTGVCDPKTNTCYVGDSGAGTVNACMACVADSQCASNRRCVQKPGNDKAYCYPLQQPGDVCQKLSFPSPISAVSVSGFSGDFCVESSATTCEARLAAFGTSCTPSEDPAVRSMPDPACGGDGAKGYCHSPGGYCTFACDTDIECVGKTCGVVSGITTNGTKFCVR